VKRQMQRDHAVGRNDDLGAVAAHGVPRPMALRSARVLVFPFHSSRDRALYARGSEIGRASSSKFLKSASGRLIDELPTRRNNYEVIVKWRPPASPEAPHRRERHQRHCGLPAPAHARFSTETARSDRPTAVCGCRTRCSREQNSVTAVCMYS
jgi:hypothetical protein